MGFQTRKTQVVMASDPSQFRFDSCRFANDERIVCVI
jgi:hypothetical protein|tara:strand:+ start:660 stop:770 length:111 start_codon:yes stop_codon:yes gene_type:complete